MRDFGTKVEIRLRWGEVVQGWLMGETSLGTYLALDPNARAVRFVPRIERGGVHYAREEAKANFALADREPTEQAIRSLAEQLDGPMGAALDRLDHNRIKRLGKEIYETSLIFENLLYEAHSMPADRWQLPAWPIVTARNIHAQLLDELDRSGVGAILAQNPAAIRDAISRTTLPQMQAEVASDKEINEAIQLARARDYLTGTDFGRRWLSRPETNNILTVPAAAPPPSPESALTGRVGLVRAVLGWTRILAGGAMTASSAGLGIFGGAVGTFPTLGLTTVPVAVGVAGSIFSGLNMAAQALNSLYGEGGETPG
jgi:hypothetical protein